MVSNWLTRDQIPSFNNTECETTFSSSWVSDEEQCLLFAGLCQLCKDEMSNKIVLFSAWLEHRGHGGFVRKLQVLSELPLILGFSKKNEFLEIPHQEREDGIQFTEKFRENMFEDRTCNEFPRNWDDWYRLMPFGTEICNGVPLLDVHYLNCRIYERLVIDLGRERLESKKVIGFWNWLEEEKGCKGLMVNLFTTNDLILDESADEATMCLDCANEEEFQPPLVNDDIWLTSYHARREISLGLVRENRESLVSWVAKFMENVGNIETSETDSQKDLGDIEDLPSLFDGMFDFLDEPEMKIEQEEDPFEEQTVMGINDLLKEQYWLKGSICTKEKIVGCSIIPEVQSVSCFFVPEDEWSIFYEYWPPLSDNFFRERQAHNEEQHVLPNNFPHQEQTLIVSLMKQPVSEEEITDYFNRAYGDCVEAILPHKYYVVAEQWEPLSYLVVFNLASTVAYILDGRKKPTFLIHGKTVKAVRPGPRNR